MTNQEILSALLAFALGLLSKFLYDFWADKRRKQEITFTKKTLSSFSVSALGERLRDRTQVVYNAEPVQSIQLVTVELENTGSRAVKNQAFTVRFDDGSRILGQPKSLTSSEDMRFVKEERFSDKPNIYRFNIQLLQRGHRLSWEFAVVDNLSGNITIEPGVATTGDNLNEVDLDVESVVTGSKAQLDLIGQVKRSIALLVWIVVIEVLKNIAIGLLDSLGVGNIAATLLNTIIVTLLLIFLYNISNMVAPLIEIIRSLSESKGTLMTVHGGAVSINDFVGRDRVTSMSTTNMAQMAISNELTQKFAQIYKKIDELPETTGFRSEEKAEVKDTVKKIESEIKYGENANPSKIERWLRFLAAMSNETLQMATDALSSSDEGIPTAVRLIAQKAIEKSKALPAPK